MVVTGVVVMYLTKSLALCRVQSRGAGGGGSVGMSACVVTEV